MDASLIEKRLIDQRVQLEILNGLRDSNIPMTIGLLIIQLIVLYALWEPALAWKLIVWAAALQLTTVWSIIAIIFFKESLAKGAANVWLAYAYFFAFYTGTCWAYGYYLFSPADQVNWVLLITILAIAFVGIHFLSSEIYSAVLFMTPIFIGIVVKHILSGKKIDLYVAGLNGVLFFVSLGTAIRQNKNFKNSIVNAFLQQEIQKRLQEQAQELKRLNQEKNHFFNAAGHDLRQPLHALFLHTGVLFEKNQDAALNKTIDGIKRTLNAFENLLDELLDISRLESEIIQPNLKHFLVHPIFEKIAYEFLPLAQEKDIELVVHPTSVCLYSDPVFVERILRNLVHNAIKYTRQGKVLIGCRKRLASGLIQVWDSGIGMSDTDISKIFQDFYQANNPNRSSKQGIGLGLGIVRRLTEALKHKIDVRSWHGRGSVFTVTVPIGDSIQVQYKELGQNAAFEATKGVNRRVLIVEDEALIINALTDVLENWQYQVQSAMSKNTVLALLSELENPPDILIVDYQFSPDLTGYQLIEMIREKFGKPIPAIVTTGNLEVIKNYRHENNGVYFLLKPIAPAKLRALMHHL